MDIAPYFEGVRQSLSLLLQYSRFARLLRDNQSKLAAKITEEQGKTLADAEGDVLRGIRKYNVRFISLNLLYNSGFKAIRRYLPVNPWTTEKG